ncbi:anaphase-promoting complex subunit 6 [Raphidocelis subcapitata]|uniref:Anaphase-promoting complex subunit 6 n=1 Tax=Raphidocelis subcapitata TaxID=307507 RepID=A0A2V0NXE8_9CHLO|nr:anaphase-promoting complex subunit 6 [Raphidocelis subcapitata]|eukprot:GBF89495.1 anaphase-promoting complex subunit 6 [Raphidocelis subcapitata]
MGAPAAGPAAHAASLRALVQDCIAKHLYGTAVFFADKLVSLTDYGAGDVFLLAQTYYVSHQFRRAAMLLRQHGLMEDVRFRYLAAKCFAEVGEWDEVLALLADGEPDDLAASQSDAPAAAAAAGREIATPSAVCLLRGRAYEALDNRAAAAQWYRAALSLDPFCEEALSALLDHHLLTNAEELALVDGLPLGPEHRWLWLLYRCRCKKYNQAACMEQQLAELEAPCSSGAAAAVAAAAAPAGDGDFARRAGAGAAGAAGGAGTAGVLQPSAQRQQAATPSAAQQRRQQLSHQRQPPSQQQSQPQQPATQRKAAAAGTPARDTRTARRAGTKQQPQPPGAAAAGAAAAPASALAPAGGASPGGCGLGSNTGVVACRAEWLHHQGRHEECYALTERALERDPYATECLPPHLASALALGRKNELFLRSHQLVEEYPDSALSWFSVGCYYMAARHFEAARRHFSKATALDRNSAHAWVGFGHAFAAQDESDQALAAYRTAARLFPGLHTPVLGMGMEYSRMNNLGLAERLFHAAHKLCPEDPLVAHEIGVLEYRNGRYALAERWLRTALAHHAARGGSGGGGGGGGPAAEASLLALGHARRKLGDYPGAIEAYRGALAIAPNAASTHAAVAFALQLSGDAAGAVREYHVALGLRPDDTFAQEMLGEALREECERAAGEAEDGLGF